MDPTPTVDGASAEVAATPAAILHTCLCRLSQCGGVTQRLDIVAGGSSIRVESAGRRYLSCNTVVHICDALTDASASRYPEQCHAMPQKLSMQQLPSSSNRVTRADHRSATCNTVVHICDVLTDASASRYPDQCHAMPQKLSMQQLPGSSNRVGRASVRIARVSSPLVLTNTHR